MVVVVASQLCCSLSQDQHLQAVMSCYLATLLQAITRNLGTRYTMTCTAAIRTRPGLCCCAWPSASRCTCCSSFVPHISSMPRFESSSAAESHTLCLLL